MKPEQYKRALDSIEKRLTRLFSQIHPQEVDYSAQHKITPEKGVAHILTMLPKMREYLAHGNLSKLDRWLGFVQGYLHAFGIFSLNELRKMNMPADEEFVEG